MAVMDFFEHQEMARKRTTRLVVLYAFAVLAIVVLVYIAVATFFMLSQREGRTGALDADAYKNIELLAYVGGGVLLIVGGASLFKLGALRAGGHVVAKALGGKRVSMSTRDAVERKVLNVVEEMAIASGTPTPTVYLLDNESRINAFAAGYRPEQAVIGVTRGCAELLTRDELQGVVAHEFSHILNGDMRLNIRLIAILHGILVIGLIGAYMMRAAAYSGRSRRKDGAGGLIILGLILMILGYVGTFFGGLIKAAVSRQREFLADASAVDFTRNPGGIAGALKKIGASVSGARLRSPNAGQFSHMYFGQGIRTFLHAMATHPPLPERIRRIEPRWDGRFPVVAPPEPEAPPPREFKPEKAKLRHPIPDILAPAVLAGAVAQVGHPTPEHVDYAQQLLAGLPERLKDAVHTTTGARAVTYALLLDADEESRTRQWSHLEAHAGGEVYEATRALAPEVAGAGPEARLPLLDLAIAALREMTHDEYEAYKRNFVALAGADRKIDRFEWLLRRIILSYLEPHFKGVEKAGAVQFYNLAGVKAECSQLLSTLAHEGHADPEEAEGAFRAGAGHLGVEGPKLLPAGECSLRALDAALDKLATVTPRLKKRVLEACAASIGFDKRVSVEEGEFFRGIADVLDCPMPPLLPGQSLA